MKGHDPESDIRAEVDTISWHSRKFYPELEELAVLYNKEHPGATRLDFWKLYIVPPDADDVVGFGDVRESLKKRYGPDYVLVIRKMIPGEKRKVQQRRGRHIE